MNDESKSFISFLKALPNIKVEMVVNKNVLVIRFADTVTNVSQIFSANLDLCEDQFSGISDILNNCALEFCERVYNK